MHRILHAAMEYVCIYLHDSSSLLALYLENSDLDCGTNNRNHHTGDIGCQNLVVRRGQAFEIKLQFSPRGYEEGVDQLSLIVQTGIILFMIFICEMYHGTGNRHIFKKDTDHIFFFFISVEEG